jgi:hypothetical protein
MAAASGACVGLLRVEGAATDDAVEALEFSTAISGRVLSSQSAVFLRADFLPPGVAITAADTLLCFALPQPHPNWVSREVLDRTDSTLPRFPPRPRAFAFELRPETVLALEAGPPQVPPQVPPPTQLSAPPPGRRKRERVPPTLRTNCAVRAVVPVPAVRDALRQLTRQSSQWSAGAREPAVALLRLSDRAEEERARFVDRFAAPVRGESVRVVSTPFGALAPNVFFNSEVAGVVSNVLNASAFFVDARVLPGSIGGAVFNAEGALVGMLAAPLVLRAEPRAPPTFTLHVAISAPAILAHLRAALAVEAPHPQPPLDLRRAVLLDARSARDAAVPVVRAAERSVCAVRAGSKWGTAVLVSSSGFLLTAAHLVRHLLLAESDAPPPNDSPAQSPKPLLFPRIEHSVFVRLEPQHFRARRERPRVWIRATVAYVSRGPWDLALLEVEQGEELATCEFADALPEPGARALAVGFGHFQPPAGMRPTVTAGDICRVVEVASRRARSLVPSCSPRRPLAARQARRHAAGVVSRGGRQQWRLHRVRAHGSRLWPRRLQCAPPRGHR